MDISERPQTSASPLFVNTSDSYKYVGHTIHTIIQCTPLLVEKTDVTLDITLWITVHKQERVQVRDPLWI